VGGLVVTCTCGVLSAGGGTMFIAGVGTTTAIGVPVA